MSEKVTMNLAQQKLDRNFEWCCMFKDLEFKALSCIGMKDLGRVFGCVEGCLFLFLLSENKHWLDILCTRSVLLF